MNSASPTPSENTENDLSKLKLGGRIGSLGNDIEIFYDHPLPRFAPPNVHVYHARSKRGQSCLAYICDRGVFPRQSASEKYAALQNISMARLIARGIATSPDGVERYGFAYENTLGNPIVANKGEPLAYGWRPDLVIQLIIKPLTDLLIEFHNADMVHGGIRADNLFDGGAVPLQRIIVGDCLSGTYLSPQPDLYLPPCLAIAHPMGRGLGNPADDIYALGVTCAVLLRSQDPFANKSNEEILLNKIDLGTFSTLIESERLPSNILELLRGLLHDDHEMRWTVHNIQEWLDGKRVTHRQRNKRLKGSRHLILGEHKILLPSLLSYHASKDITRAIKLVQSSEIKQWIRRSVSDTRLDTRYDMAVEAGQDQTAHANADERTVSRLCAAMEPTFPILYRDIAVFPDSFGPVLGDLIIREADTKSLVEVINDQTVPFWMNMQNELPSDFNMIINRFEQCQQFIKQRLIGYGIERCVYFLSPEIPCLSLSLKNFFVHTSERLLHALNIIADRADRPERPLDRHMIAFLSVRERQVIERYLPELGASEPYRIATGVISVFASIQAATKSGPLPGLSRWVAQISVPLYARFHDRDTRKYIQKKIDELKDSGMITRIADILFDLERVRRDQTDFRLAMNEYTALSNEKILLSRSLKNQARFGTQSGRDIAALIAGVLMSLSIAGFVLIHLLNGGWRW